MIVLSNENTEVNVSYIVNMSPLLQLYQNSKQYPKQLSVPYTSRELLKLCDYLEHTDKFNNKLPSDLIQLCNYLCIDISNKLLTNIAPLKYIDEDNRFVIEPVPVSRQHLYELYKGAFAVRWRPEEIILTEDRIHYNTRLTKNEQRFVEYVLAFFAQFDGIINMGLAERFLVEIDIPEAKCFMGEQYAMEIVHARTYALQLISIIDDKEKRHKLLHSIKTIPIITKMCDWSTKWVKSNNPFAERLLYTICVEGIFFSGAFCAIYWLQTRGVMSGLCQANEFISRDEGLHVDFSMAIYDLIVDYEKLSISRIYDIVNSAVDISKEFINDALTVDLNEMNAKLMSQYIEYVADNIIVRLGVKPFFNVKNPFPFMGMINMKNKTNFFEKHVTEYENKCEVSVSNINDLSNDDF